MYKRQTYTYTITEVTGSEDGMTYDSLVVTYTVEVTDAGGGVLTVTPSIPEDTEFNNSYEASGSWTPAVTKVLDAGGRELAEGEFTFELKRGEEVLQTKKNAAGGSVTFDAIEYTQADIGKTYTYTITEVTGSEDGMTYDLSLIHICILQNMIQRDGTFTEVTDPSQLTAVFEAIAGQIAAAVKNAEVTDPMGVGFEVPIGAVENIHATQGDVDYENNTISWNPGTLTKPVNSDIKFAELTYRIEINDDILNAPHEEGLYKTNGNASITYKNASDETVTTPFPVPQVDPVLLIEMCIRDRFSLESTNDDPAMLGAKATLAFIQMNSVKAERYLECLREKAVTEQKTIDEDADCQYTSYYLRTLITMSQIRIDCLSSVLDILLSLIHI